VRVGDNLNSKLQPNRDGEILPVQLSATSIHSGRARSLDTHACADLSAPIYLRQVSICAKSLSAPSRAEQKRNSGDDRERRVRPCLDRLIERFDELIGHFAHGAGRIAALAMGVSEHVVDA
jgi:hypothetical protein